MSSWSLFPPRTQELQLDEKWAFVYRKQRDCDLENSEDHHQGDCWDHVAFDPEHRLVLGVICGKRSSTRISQLMGNVKRQLQDRLPRLITSDEFGPYRHVVDQLWNSPPRPAPCGQGRRRRSQRKTKSKLNYATVCKHREGGRVVEVKTQIVFGSKRSIARALKQSSVSSAINTSFLERHNGTDRHRNARKVRRTYRFSKDWNIHEAVTFFSYYTYNFCWCVRTLRKRMGRKHRYQPRTPAMSAGLTDHVWNLKEWLTRPVTALTC